MGEKLPVLYQAITQLREQEKTDLADELSKLVEELSAQFKKKQQAEIETTTQKIDAFLKTNEAEVACGERKGDLANLASEVQETKKQGSRRDRLWGKQTEEVQEESSGTQVEQEPGENAPEEESSSFRAKVAKRGAALGAVFLAVKLRGSKPDAQDTVPKDRIEPGSFGPKRQEIINQMNVMIEKDKQKPIGYDFDDPNLGTDRDINCSGLVYEVIQKCGCFEMTRGGVTSASLYKSMREKGRPVRPIITHDNTTPDISGIQPGDTVFRASTNPEFSRKNGNCPASVDGKPIHHSAIIQSIESDGHFTVLESTGSKGVQVQRYDANRRLQKRKDELHVVRMPYDPIA